MSDDKGKSGEEVARDPSPPPQQGRVFNPNNPPAPPEPAEERPVRRPVQRAPLPQPLRERLTLRFSFRRSNREPRRPTSPNPYRDQRIRDLPEGAEAGIDDSFRRTRDRVASPYPEEKGKIGPVPGEPVPGARGPGFGVAEGIVSTGAVGGYVASVDTHPYGEVATTQHDTEYARNVQDDEAGPSQPTESSDEERGRVRSFFRSVGGRVKEFAGMVLPSSILGPRQYMLLPPPESPAEGDDVSSGTHPSLASASLDLDVSTADSEAQSFQERPGLIPKCVDDIPLPPTPDLAEGGADQPMETEDSDRPATESEDAVRRAAFAAAAVSEADQDSDHSSDDEEYQNVYVKQLQESRTRARVEETAAAGQPGPSASSVYHISTIVPVEIHVAYEDSGHVTTCISFDTPPTIYEESENESDIDEF